MSCCRCARAWGIVWGMRGVVASWPASTIDDAKTGGGRAGTREARYKEAPPATTTVADECDVISLLSTGQHAAAAEESCSSSPLLTLLLLLVLFLLLLSSVVAALLPRHHSLSTSIYRFFGHNSGQDGTDAIRRPPRRRRQRMGGGPTININHHHRLYVRLSSEVSLLEASIRALLLICHLLPPSFLLPSFALSCSCCVPARTAT